MGMIQTLQERITSILFESVWIISLYHIALAIEDPNILVNLKQELDAAGVRNNGVEVDPETHDRYISFYDPDGIAWELYSVTDPPYV